MSGVAIESNAEVLSCIVLFDNSTLLMAGLVGWNTIINNFCLDASCSGIAFSFDNTSSGTVRQTIIKDNMGRGSLINVAGGDCCKQSSAFTISNSAAAGMSLNLTIAFAYQVITIGLILGWCQSGTKYCECNADWTDSLQCRGTAPIPTSHQFLPLPYQIQTLDAL